MCKKILLLLAFLVFFGISCYAEDPVNELLFDYLDIITLSQKTSFDSGDVYNLWRDIDMSGHPLPQPIGYYGAFLGKFYGNGHKISNLTFESTNDTIGLFSRNKGTIRGLIVENAKIVGNDCVGGMVAKNQGNIDSCKFIGGDVTGNDYVGGLVGYNHDGKIDSSSSSGEVTGHDIVGGLVGRAFAPSHQIQVQNSSSTCNVTGNNCVGGLIGYYIGSDIVNCYYRGLNLCDGQSLTNVIGVYSVGGLIGNFGSCIFSLYRIKNCYSLGNVLGTNNTGGIVGTFFDSIIERCFSACSVDVTNPLLTTNGCFIGVVEEGITFTGYSFYKSSNSLPNIGGLPQTIINLVLLSSAEFKEQNSYSFWDFFTTWNINDTINDGYPYLRSLAAPCNLVDDDWQPIDVDEDGYRDITNICELHWVDEHPDFWTYNLELDFPDSVIDCGGKTSTWNNSLGFLPIGRFVDYVNDWRLFAGNFNGNNDTIKNLVVTSTYHAAGFFGCVHGDRPDTTGQIIKDLILDSLQVSCTEGNMNYVGGLIGHFFDGGHNSANQRYGLNLIQNCKIKNSNINCTVSTPNGRHYLYIGGLVGGLDNGATVENCSVTSTTVTGRGAVGGLAGYTKATSIKKCYTMWCDLSTTQQDSAIGGLIGICDAYNSSSLKCNIERCFTHNVIESEYGNKIGGFIGSLAPYCIYSDGYPGGDSCRKKYVDIKNCYSHDTITVAFGQNVGGFIGYMNKGCDSTTQSHIFNSYSACVINPEYIGNGFIGEINSYTPVPDPDTVTCFWDNEIGPTTGDTRYATPKASALMKLQVTYEPYWDFGEGVPPNNIAIWTRTANDDINGGYPYLVDMPVGQFKVSMLNLNFLSDLEIVVFPNPVINLSTIEINIQKEGLIDLSLYNVLGIKVSTIVSGKVLEGSNYYNFDASQLNSDTYYIVLRTSNDMISKTVVINK